MRFIFRYESLLSYRRHLKEKAEVDFGRVRQQLKTFRLLLEDLRGRFLRADEFFGSRGLKRISSAEIKNHADFLAGLKDKIRAQELKVAEWEVAVREKKEELLRKTKDFRVIEKLREKDFEKWQQQQLQMEQKDTNEVAVTRHGRVFL